MEDSRIRWYGDIKRINTVRIPRQALVVYNKENLERQETNKYGRGTERHLPKTDEGVALFYC